MIILNKYLNKYYVQTMRYNFKQSDSYKGRYVKELTIKREIPTKSQRIYDKVYVLEKRSNLRGLRGRAGEWIVLILEYWH